MNRMAVKTSDMTVDLKVLLYKMPELRTQSGHNFIMAYKVN